MAMNIRFFHSLARRRAEAGAATTLTGDAQASDKGPILRQIAGRFPRPQGRFETWGTIAPITPTDARSAIRVRIEHGAAADPIWIAMRQLMLMNGRSFRIVRHGDCDVFIGGHPLEGSAARWWIDPTRSKPTRSNKLFSADCDHGRANGTPADHRLQQSTSLHSLLDESAQWLTLGRETSLKRDPHGRVSVAESGITPGSDPRVHLLAAQFESSCLSIFGDCAHRIPRWPHSKRYAVVVTHDVDQPQRENPLVTIARGAADARSVNPRKLIWGVAKRLRTESLRETLQALVAADRQWDFDHYRRIEAACGIKSAYYFASTSRRDGMHLDVDYDLSAARFARLSQSLTAGGWEVGVHLGYETSERAHSTASQVKALESALRVHCYGTRHHYLRLDTNHPLRSLTDHAVAGLDYDTSIGFNDGIGFRAGVAAPYFPLTSQDTSLDQFVELPMTLMDQHLSRDDASAAVKATRAHIEHVRRLGAMAVVNFHVGQWERSPAWRMAFVDLCRMLHQDSDVWVARPVDVARWWRFKCALQDGTGSNASNGTARQFCTDRLHPQNTQTADPT